MDFTLHDHHHLSFSIHREINILRLQRVPMMRERDGEITSLLREREREREREGEREKGREGEITSLPEREREREREGGKERGRKGGRER